MPDFIKIRGAREHNLKNIDVDIPKNCLVVVTGPSGSGKSSLAFDTLYAEGQRRYVESLSSYTRHFLNIQDKPDFDSIEGLIPAIAIDQKTTSRSSRSTVGTMTEIYDYLRLLFARIGIVYSPTTNLPINKYSIPEIVFIIMKLPLETKIRICSPIIQNKKSNCEKEIQDLKNKNYQKVKINGKIIELESITSLDGSISNSIEIIIDRIIIKENIESRILDVVERALKASEGTLILDVVEISKNIIINNIEIKNGSSIILTNKYICHLSNFFLEEIEPKIFSFNSPFGACEACHGIGTEVFFKEDLIIPDKSLSLLQGAIEPWTRNDQRYHNQLILALAKKYDFNPNIPYEKLPENIRKILLHGSNGEKISIEIQEEYRKYNIEREFLGVIAELKTKLEATDDEFLLAECEKYQDLTECHVCNGYRLKKEIMQIKINGMHIGEVSNLSIDDLIKWFEELPKFLSQNHNEIAVNILKEIKIRLGFLVNVGLDYLTLGRSSPTLSNGECQRIRLSSQIGSGLTGILYVLDEPSIGLHQSDNNKLISTLKKLRDIGNSIVVIEHDEETMRAADYIIDVGPGAGKYGGNITAKGKVDEILANKESITGLFLSGDLQIELPKTRRKYGKNNYIEIKNAREHNLKNINVKIPLGMFVSVCGVSGGGKSTLILDVLYAAIAKKLNGSKERPGLHDEILGIDNIDKIIKIDQSAIGRTPRSNPATYTGLFILIRDWFTSLPDSRIRGYKSGRFSFNVKGGRCENCQGDGLIKIEMHFLPDVYINCDVCHGKRYNKETLEIKYKGFSIADILNMTVREAMDIFQEVDPIKEKLYALFNVGLDYIKLGQSATTVSGGEAQRIKLAKELSKKATGNTLYILDEPTTGLHSCDIKRLLTVLHKLVDYGNTILVIEHNLDVIKTADYVIDIGPRGGIGGGYIVAQGTPEEIVLNKNSVTGKYLINLLDKKKLEEIKKKQEEN